ncbi:MAG: class I SAM-dependent methyltransferase [Bacteroidota bacterium]|nr:class I SAM-dependent methyltransferase [Bacteroidota bacterium]
MMNKKHRYWDKQAAKSARLSLIMAKQFNECKNLIIYHLEPSSHLADLGCGIGYIAYELSDFVDSIHAIDYSEAMISMAKARKRSPEHDHIHLEIGNIEHTSIKENSKEACLLCHILNYHQNPEIVLLESKRIVKPNGIIISNTCCHGSIRSFRGFLNWIGIYLKKLLNTSKHYKVYTFKSLRKELEASGMVIIAEKKLRIKGNSVLFTILKT